jgi:hypothetical protein
MAAEVYRRRLHWTLPMGATAALSGMLVHGLVDAAVWGNKVAFMQERGLLPVAAGCDGPD